MTSFDGRVLPYIPGDELGVDPALVYFEALEETDPITYEVLRHSLWNLNEEHGATIVKVSGSPIALYSHDFNPTICRADGEIVLNGPYIQFFSGIADLVVKWTLENRSASPGIREGDVFVASDPWIGTTHQPDNYVLAPVFRDGKLFSWVVNTLHLHEIGGTTPGSFCVEARDVFWEPAPVPPVKLVDGGVLREDLLDLLTRRSRVANLVALDIRAQLAGATAAARRMHDLCDRYGATTVNGAMERMVTACQRALDAKLQRMPDGVWRDVQYTGVALPGDEACDRIELTVEKRDKSLIVRNAGTDPQREGTLSCTFAGWRAAVLAALSSTLTSDQLYVTGGLVRRVQFEPTPGTLTCASFPAAVTMYTGTLITAQMAVRIVAKMLLATPDLRGDVLGSCGVATTLGTAFGGTDRNGHPFGTVSIEPNVGALGAAPHRDGISTGGMWWDPRSSIANCEENERYYPFRYLQRREARGAGGHGRWRGGDGLVVSWAAHDTDDLRYSPIAAGSVIPSAPGLAGGYPGAPGGNYLRREDGTPGVRLRSKEPERRLAPGEFIEMQTISAGGYGDPIDRDVDLVAGDVASGRDSPDTAERIYGVALSASGAVDHARTQALRAGIRERRIASGSPGSALSSSAANVSGLATAARMRIGDILGVAEAVLDGASDVGQASIRFICCSCGWDLGPCEGNYKDHALMLDEPLTSLGDSFVDPVVELPDAELVARQYACPGCGSLLECEIARRSDEPVRDMELDPQALESLLHPVSEQ